MAKIINFQEYIDRRKEKGMCKNRTVVLSDQSMKTEETEEAGGKRPYIIVIY